MARCRSELPESAIAFRKFLLQVGEIPVIADLAEALVKSRLPMEERANEGQ